MEIKEISKKENPLFNRREIEIVVEMHANPKNSEAEKIISEKYSSPSENIKIKRIMGRFGSNKFTITANIYSSKEEKEKTEIKLKKAKASAPAESKPEEKKE